MELFVCHVRRKITVEEEKGEGCSIAECFVFYVTWKSWVKYNSYLEHITKLRQILISSWPTLMEDPHLDVTQHFSFWEIDILVNAREHLINKGFVRDY